MYRFSRIMDEKLLLLLLQITPIDRFLEYNGPNLELLGWCLNSPYGANHSRVTT